MTTAAIRPRPSAAGSSQPDLAVTAYRLADIGVVRRRLTEALRMCECVEPLIDTAVLLATELLGNALRHAAPGGRPLVVRLDMHWNGRGLTLAVSDPDPRVAGRQDRRPRRGERTRPGTPGGTGRPLGHSSHRDRQDRLVRHLLKPRLSAGGGPSQSGPPPARCRISEAVLSTMIGWFPQVRHRAGGSAAGTLRQQRQAGRPEAHSPLPPYRADPARRTLPDQRQYGDPSGRGADTGLPPGASAPGGNVKAVAVRG